jgi:hypothetical protein
MKNEKGKIDNSFEHNIYLALKRNGLLFPKDDKEISDLEGPVDIKAHELPVEFENGNAFIPKTTKIIQLKPSNFKAVRSVRYAKVAAKRGRKKKR